MAFPDGQLRRVQSGVNVHYVLAGIKRRANPLPVKSRTDSPAVSRQPQAASPQPPIQRMSPGQQSIPRTPTPPVQNQMPPAWNPTRQQGVGVPQQPPTLSMQRPFDQRSAQIPGVNQQRPQQQQQHQLPGVGQVSRIHSFPNQGTIQTTSDQASILVIASKLTLSAFVNHFKYNTLFVAFGIVDINFLLMERCLL